MNFNIIKFNRTGIQIWLLMRVSAIIIFLYLIYIVSFFLIQNHINYVVWHNFFSYIFTKIFTIITLIAIISHSWIGLWQVLTDYIKSNKIRLFLYCFLIFLLLYYFIYGVIIVVGV